LGHSFLEQDIKASRLSGSTQEVRKAFQFLGRFSRPSNISCLIILLLAFILLISALPLRTTLRISADEDFEFAKVELCSKGYQLYTQIWNDQPPLYTFLLARAAKITSSVLGMGELNILFSLLLIIGLYCPIHVDRPAGLLSPRRYSHAAAVSHATSKMLLECDMTIQRLAAELEATKPGIILLANDSRAVPYQELLSREYQLVYVDPSNRLLVHKSIAKQGQHLSAP
jgi:hypothetical protein